MTTGKTKIYIKECSANVFLEEFYSVWPLFRYLINSKGNQPWIFIGRTDAEAEAPILWPPDAKNWLIWEDPDAGKDWRQDEKGTTEDEMVGWHHWLDGHEFEQALGVVMVREGWRAAVHGVANWTVLHTTPHHIFICLSVDGIRLS